MSYELVLEDAARDQLRKAPASMRPRLALALRSISADPHARGVRKLEDQHSGFRVRVGKWRVLYKIDSKKATVYVYSIEPRDRAYRKR